MIDLHVHTNNSDGTCTPAEVIDMAKAMGLNAIAITDHDSARGVAEGVRLGREKGLRVIPGIEINAKYEEHNTHIVGLFIDPESQALKEFSLDLVKRRLHRNIALIEKLQELGYNIDFDDFPDFAAGQVMSKGNIGRVMVEKGYFDDVSTAIETLMDKGCPAYIPKKSCTPMEAIDTIHAAGGIAVLAHYHQIDKKNPENAERIARIILEYGADAIETRYSEFDEEKMAKAEAFAAEYNKLKSGGSDFHGSTKPKIALGTGWGDLSVPDEYLEKMEEFLENKKNQSAFGGCLGFA